MGLMKMGQGEVKRADVSAPFRALVFPFLELILITGVLWIAIGWCDAQGVDPMLRNGLVVLWAGLSTWRFLIPLYRARRKRFIVTNQRIVARPAKLTAKVDSIPLGQVLDVARRRKGISLAVRGFSYPLYFGGVPKSKKVVGEINNALHPSPYF